MRLGSITKLSRDVEYTTDRDAFELRVRIQGIPEKHINLLWKIYKLIHLTDYTPEKVREVFTKGTTYADVAEKYDVSLGTIKRQVYDFSQWLKATWGRDDVIDKMRAGEDIDESYLNSLETIVDDSLRASKIIEKNLEDKFTIDIISGSDVNQNFGGIDKEDFVMMRNKLVTLSRPSQEFILKNTDKKLISYGVYLLTTPDENLIEEDLIRKKELITFTKIDI